jgi:hypothetical protein
MQRRLVVLLAVVLGVCLALPAQGQERAAPWWAGVFEVDARTLLTLTADTGREVRSGRRGEIRHGVEVPLVITEGGEQVEMTIASADHASRWTLRRTGDEVVIEEWARRGPDGAPWERVRTVRAPLPR